MFESQMKEGDPYQKLERAVTINILNFNYLIENDRYHNTHLLKKKETDEVLTDLQKVDFIELPKLNSDSKKVRDDLIPWNTLGVIFEKS
ncbi:hypothetical protein U472_11425 [Orenia metallireducens]|uniref:Uncharacterized protein n=1 Tax=Orenia metallireducens TaxID=1413210 RepID=A0A1C0A8K4_9FIRM|nr:hypothetical protein U472_11425 [Orenia metallireducens]